MKNGKFVVLSIYEVHMASAALMVDGEVLAAAHEERFSRIKNDCGFPLHSAQFCLAAAGVLPEEVDVVAMVNQSFSSEGISNILFKRPALFSIADWISENELYWRAKLCEGRDPGAYFDLLGGWERVPSDHHYDLSRLNMFGHSEHVSKQFNALRKDAVERLLHIPAHRVEFVEHYPCHHYHAYYSGPLRGDDVLVAHCEGSGGLYNQALSVNSANGLRFIAGTNQCDLGRLYQWVTLILGMKPYHHEYKLMGLAPHANSHEVARTEKVFSSIFDLDEEKMVTTYGDRPQDLFFAIRARLAGHRFDGIAGALQKTLEEKLAEWLTLAVKRTGRRRVCFGGGVAMNIKANMVLAALPDVEDFFVPLSPADESNVFGAGYMVTERHFLSIGRNPEDIPPISGPYLGRAPKRDTLPEVRERASAHGFDTADSVGPASIANLLRRGNVVARCTGRSEFGQRALGNRSILADPSSDGTVDKINSKIKYRDFWMPFAPSIMAEAANDFLANPKGLRAPHMTIGFETRSESRSKIKQAIHPADSTARPHIVTREANPDYHRLIECFCELTGVGGLLNTSFNLHGEPIVDTYEDALRVFVNSDLDALWLGDELLVLRS